MNPSISWVKDLSKTEELLKYNQILFDLIELHRRKAQHILHRIQNVYFAEEKFRTQNQKCSDEIKQFQNDTKLGTELSAIEYWEERVQKELTLTPLEVIPKISDKNFGYGLTLGLGSGFFSNPISTHFTPTFNFVYGFDLSFKKINLFLNGTLAGNKVKKEYIQKDGLVWKKDLKTRVAVLDISFGYPVVDNLKKKITPFAGLGIVEFSISKEENEEHKKYNSINYGLIYGLNWDLKLRTNVFVTLPQNTYYLGERGKREHILRIKLYITSGKIEDIKSRFINLSIGYVLSGKGIKVKM